MKKVSSAQNVSRLSTVRELWKDIKEVFTWKMKKGFKGTKCTKTFNSKINLERHQRSVHMENEKRFQVHKMYQDFQQ